MIHVALIGCGRIADLHALGYRDNARARIHSVCDLDPAVAERRRQEWGADKVARFEAILADPEIHAVEILTPHDQHERQVVQALQAGKHVALQKPMTTDLASADRMLQAAAARPDRVFKVTDNYLTYPPLVLAKKLLDEGAIGDPLSLHLKYIGGSSGGWPIEATSWDWRIREAVAGRPFVTFDHGHHMLAVAWHLFGEVERVVAWIDSLDGVVDSPAVIMWKHQGAKRYGVLDAVHAPDMHVPSKYYANDEWFEIAGSRGLLLLRRCTGNVLDGPPVSLFDGQGWKHFDDVDSDWAAGFVGATHNFLDAIEGKAPPLLTGAQGREVLRFSLALQRSAAVRREVYLDEMDGTIGRLGAWQRRRREQRPAQGSRFSLRGGGRTTRYAPLARSLTDELVRSVDAATARQIDFDVGVRLTTDGGVEDTMGFFFSDGRVRCERGSLPEHAGVTLTLPAGLWAAILMRKARVETALLRGQIRFDGKPELALKLRKVFQL
ncbi:MAG: Gfo/Idh/MocA family oxidoreductase [Pseudomonadota bacterium]